MDSALRRCREAGDGRDQSGARHPARPGAGDSRRRHQPPSRDLPQSGDQRRLFRHRAYLLSARRGQDARHRLGARAGGGERERARAEARCVPDVLRARRLRHPGRCRGARTGAAGSRQLERGPLVGNVARHGKGKRTAQQRRAPPAHLLAALERADGSGSMTIATRSVVTRAQVEDFLYYEAALLDDWKLDEWEKLLTDDAAYYVPPNDQLESDHRSTLFIVADDRERIRQRVIRINDPNCHAEYPKSRTRRMISNVRIVSVDGDLITVSANFVCYRFRRYERIREYVGGYRFVLRRAGDTFRIKERRVLIDAHELGTLGSVSFIL